MKKTGYKLGALFRLIGVGLFFRWCFILLSMDAYLFSDPASYLFWSTAIKRVILSAIISSGLLITSFKFGQKYKIITIPLILLSLIGSLFVVPEMLYWVSWVILILIHGFAIFNLFKPIVMPPSPSTHPP